MCSPAASPGCYRPAPSPYPNPQTGIDCCSPLHCQPAKVKTIQQRHRSLFHPVPLCMPTSLCWCPLDAACQKLVQTTQDHPVCVWAKLATMGLQDPIMHKDMEALLPKLLYCILLQVTTIKASILMISRTSISLLQIISVRLSLFNPS